MRKNKLKKIWLISIFIIALISLGAIFYYNKAVIYVPSSTNQNESSQKVENIVNSEVLAPSDNLSSLSMPILMYHHIRVFNDSNDEIGTNLSVDPEKFVNQLDLIRERGYTTVTFNDINNGNIPEKPIILTFDDGYRNFYENAYPELRQRGMKAVVFIITSGINHTAYMTSAQIKEISDYGIEIGDHTISHPDLSKLKADNVKKEIGDSKTELESLIGKPVFSFCYPSGKFNNETKEIVKESGYKFAVTTKTGITLFNDLMQLNRFRVNYDTDILAYLK